MGQRVQALTGSATALLIRRAGGRLLPNPDGETILEPGDVVVTVGESDTGRSPG